MLNRLKRLFTMLRRDTLALLLALGDRRVPWRAKAIVVAALAYTLWPIDLIPDVIPFAGWLDDAIVLPWGMSKALAMVPAPILVQHRAQVASHLKPVLLGAGALVAGLMVIWLALLAWAVSALWTLLN